MEWYKLTFRQKEPIHIGSLSWGVINQTLTFIPGWTIWGALTKAYNISKGENLSYNQELFENITCFYPTIHEKNSTPLFPQYKNGTLHFDNYPEDQFRCEFTDTLVSTSIVTESRSAKEESLHETEILLNRGKIDGKELYWTGLLGIDTNIAPKIEAFLKKGLKIYVGADARYGFGCLELIHIVLASENELVEWSIKDRDNIIQGNSKNEVVIKNFLEFDKNLNFEGELTLLAEFNFQKNTPEIKEAKYFITPGSKVLNLQLKDYKLKKGKLYKK